VWLVVHWRYCCCSRDFFQVDMSDILMVVDIVVVVVWVVDVVLADVVVGCVDLGRGSCFYWYLGHPPHSVSHWLHLARKQLLLLLLMTLRPPFSQRVGIEQEASFTSTHRQHRDEANQSIPHPQSQCAGLFNGMWGLLIDETKRTFRQQHHLDQIERVGPAIDELDGSVDDNNIAMETLVLGHSIIHHKLESTPIEGCLSRLRAS
jgi:hypothetical protein